MSVEIVLHHRDEQGIGIMKNNDIFEHMSIIDGGALSGHLDVSPPRDRFTQHA